MKIGELFTDIKGDTHPLVMEDENYYYSHFSEYGGETIAIGGNVLSRFLKSSPPHLEG